MKAPKQTDGSVEQQLEFKSRDGQTIGMVDAILTLAVALTDRLKNENKRFNRLRGLARTTDEEFAYHSDDVLAALQDLSLNEVVRNLVYPESAGGLEIIKAATQSLKNQAALDKSRNDAVGDIASLVEFALSMRDLTSLVSTMEEIDRLCKKATANSQ